MINEKSNERATFSAISTRTIAKVAILSAISFILYMWVKFPLVGIFPAFLDIQFSDLPALIGGFALGPIPGCAIIVIKCLLKLPFSGTAYVGELADIILGIAFVLPACLIYRRKKSTKNALIGIGVGVISSTVVAMLTNFLILIPLYVQFLPFLNGKIDGLVAMCKVVFPAITNDTFYQFYIFGSVLPFNLLRTAICGALTFVTYKKLSPILHK